MEQACIPKYVDKLFDFIDQQFLERIVKYIDKNPKMSEKLDNYRRNDIRDIAIRRSSETDSRIIIE